MSKPWYAAGLRFECRPDCGSCCSGPEEGVVMVTRKEMRAIASHLKLTHRRFARQLLTTVPGVGQSLREKPNGDCVFLGDDRRCTIYSVRPRQCRTFPFWRENLESPGAWNSTCERCPGAVPAGEPTLGDGAVELISVEEITRRVRWS